MHPFAPKRPSKCSRHAERFPSSCWLSQHIAPIDNATTRGSCAMTNEFPDITGTPTVGIRELFFYII
ncbi:hypothetical protein HMPREF9344_01629 [Cutibacterium acnes HL097PA1]|nr:hypothetical protein HMPREF9344_01629 [Cutibacterium acnes HL097PA1]